MAGEEAKSSAGKTVAFVGVGGLIAAATAALLARPAKAAEGEVVLDEATMNLLLAIAKGTENIDADLDTLINAVQALAAALGVSTLENPGEIAAWSTLIPTVNIPVQLPDRSVPYDMHLVIKAIPTNLGIIYVANSRADSMNINSSYWLIANEAVEYKIKNAQQLWVNASRAGEGVLCTVEQRKE